MLRGDEHLAKDPLLESEIPPRPSRLHQSRLLVAKLKHVPWGHQCLMKLSLWTRRMLFGHYQSPIPGYLKKQLCGSKFRITRQEAYD